MYDSDEDAFYFWQSNAWISLRTNVNITAGDGISVVDGTISNTGDLDPSNEIQDISLSGTDLSISSGSTIDLSGLDTDTQLSEPEVDAFVANNGYITSSDLAGYDTDASDDFDGDYNSLTNTPAIFSGDFADLTNIPTDLSDGDQIDDADADATNELITGVSLETGNILRITDAGGNNDVDLTSLASGGFSGEFSALSNIPAGLSDGDDVDDADADATNELITGISLEPGNVLRISDAGGNNDVDLSSLAVGFSGDFSDLTNIPAGLADGDDVNDADASVTNELLTGASLSGTILTLTDAGGNTLVDLAGLQDGTGTDDQNAGEVAVTPSGGVTSTNVQDALVELQSEIASSGGGDMLEAIYDSDGNNTVDDAELVNGLSVETAVPAGAVFTDTQLTEAEVDAFVANNGYITTEVDGSTTNEIQDLQLATDILTITNNGSATPIDLSGYLDNTNLTEAEVDAFVADNGYLTSEVDGSTTNEIQDLQLATNTLTITNNGSATPIDLSGYLDNTNLTETEVDAFVANNGYLTSETDGSTTNELISGGTLIGTTLRITDAGGNTDIDLVTLQDGTGTDDQTATEVGVTPANGVTSTNVQAALEELQGEIASAGGGDMLESVYDADGNNVVDDAELVNGLTVETAVPVGALFTDTQLTEAEVDAFVADNGYLTSEVDGSTTNEIQDLQIASDILSITNNGSATPIDLSGYLDNTNLTEAEVDAFVADNGYSNF